MKERMYNKVYARFLNSQDGFIGFQNKIRARKVLEILKPENNEQILEIGCNTGQLIQELTVYSQNVVGIDINHTALKIADMSNLFCMNITDMGFNDNTFDKIICLHTIEHVLRVKRAFEEIARVLKPDGSVLLTYPFEIIRGMGTIRHALAMCSSKIYELIICSFISKARKLHIHKLSPRKIRELIAESSLRSNGNSIILDPFPSYLTILKKRK